MSDQENKHSDSLDDFLKKAGKGQLQDDFEKEAAEGFSMLNVNEAHELKTQTDRRVDSLFSYGKRKQAVQWSIAAGIVLLISIAVYLIRPEVSPDNSKVVQTDISNRKEEVLPPPSPTLVQEAVTPREEKPVTTARSGPSPRPAAFKKDEPVAASQVEAPEETRSENKTAEPREEIQMASADKAAEVMETPSRADDNVALSAGQAGGGKVATLTTNSEKSKTSAAKKSPRAAYEAMPSAARDSRTNNEVPGQKLNLILRKKYEGKFDKPFTAVVTLVQGTVSDVSFAEGKLSKSEQKEIRKALRELTAEELVPTGVTVGEIELDYRP